MAMTTDAKVMLVAGGTGSIGSALVRMAREQGWIALAHGRDPATADLALDMAAPGAAAELVARAVAQHGRLDAVVDCVSAGVPGITGLFEETDPAAYTPFADVSTGWFQRLAHAALPHLRARGGTLVALVSDAGIFAAPRQAIIGAARAATVGFVRNLAVEVARDGVRIHAVSPGFVAGSASAERLGSQRMARAAARAGLGLPTADDIAPAILFLCGDGARRMTGQVLSINGGLNA